MLERRLPRTFAEPWYNRGVRQWPGLLVLAGAPLSILVLALVQQSVKGIVIGVLITLLLSVALLDMVASMWWMAVRVTVSEEGVETRSYLWRTRRLRWSEIVARREYGVPTNLYRIGPPTLQVRLVAADGRILSISGDLPGFEELHEIIRAKTPHAEVTGDTRRRWQRLTSRLG